jgi:hypothetical protein
MGFEMEKEAQIKLLFLHCKIYRLQPMVCFASASGWFPEKHFISVPEATMNITSSLSFQRLS